MLRLPVLAALAGTLIALAPATSQAWICYMVLDKSGSAIFRDQLPPVDMSSAGAAARDQMLLRGELLVILDTDTCKQIAPVRAGTLPLTADQVLSNTPPMNSSVAAPQAVPSSGRSAGVTAPMPASAPSAAPATPTARAQGLGGGGTGMRY